MEKTGKKSLVKGVVAKVKRDRKRVVRLQGKGDITPIEAIEKRMEELGAQKRLLRQGHGRKSVEAMPLKQ